MKIKDLTCQQVLNKVSTQHFIGQKRNIDMNIEDFSFHHSLSFVETFVESM